MATIRKKGSRWQVSIRRVGFKPIYQTFSKKALAEKWANQKEAEIEQGTYFDSRIAGTITLKKAISKYLDDIVPNHEISSISSTKYRLRTLVSLLGDKTLLKINLDVLLDYGKYRLETIGSDSLRKELGLLSDIFDCCRLVWKYPCENPVPEAKRVMTKLRLLTPGVRRERRLKDGEFDKITNYRTIGKIVLFAIETGMRRGEIASALREHITGSVILVPKSKTDWVKEKKGRKVPLSDKALNVVRSLPLRIDGSLFGVSPENITKAFVRMCKDLGIEDLRFHDLRHEAASRFFEKGLNIEEVAAITGHSDWSSLKRYTHPDAKSLAKKISAY